MDGFQSYTPQPAVSMGNFVSTLLQLKSQVELMDQFLSIYVPEYVQLKNYATEYQQANLFGAPFPGTVPSMPEHVMNSFIVDQGAANPKAEEDTNASTGKGKVRRKQALAKKPASATVTNNPANLKRRGRKRKYPLPNPDEESVETAQQVPVPPTVQLPLENVEKASVPIPLPATVTQTHTSNENNLSNPPGPSESSAVNQNHHGYTAGTLSGLDVLAAVSFVLKQQDMNVSSGARDVPSNSGTRNENTSEQTGISFIQEIKQEPIEENDQQQQDYDENHHQLYDVIPGAEVRVEGQESQQTLQMHKQPQYQKQTSDYLGPLTQQSVSSHIPQNPQEFVIVGPAEHEVIL